MAKEYVKKLSGLISKLNIEKAVDCRIEVKHLFTGAALYANKVICASWSPVGLAFKLPEEEVVSLISSGKAKALKYFPMGHVKKGYALFKSPEQSKPSKWKTYFIKAIRHSHE
jgi:TfoX/Sxy family transcriptional regulator of competence genes